MWICGLLKPWKSGDHLRANISVSFIAIAIDKTLQTTLDSYQMCNSQQRQFSLIMCRLVGSGTTGYRFFPVDCGSGPWMPSQDLPMGQAKAADADVEHPWHPVQLGWFATLDSIWTSDWSVKTVEGCQDRSVRVRGKGQAAGQATDWQEVG